MPKFTEKEIRDIVHEGGIYDETTETETYGVVHSEVIHMDREKNSNDVEYVIEEFSTGKFYKAVLLDSVWNGQAEYNAEQPWREVKRKETITYTYE